MKNYLMIFFCLPIFLKGQSNEFKVHDNGLIYSKQTMDQLGHIVDSLHLKFKVCKTNPSFYSIPQTLGYKIFLKNGNIREAKNDIDQNISIDDFIKKYPYAEIESDVLLIKFKQDQEIMCLGLNGSKGTIEYKNQILKEDFSKQWISEYQEKSDYYEEKLYAFYFPENFKSILLPEKYCKMIAYADCLIDTNNTKIKEDAKSGYVDLPENWYLLSLKEKKDLLEKMRKTRVVGQCSMDSSPRDHAVNIAILSAETYQWEVFLRAHLDIMNDRFERTSDGSWAWADRNTYIKELEVLNINVLDLIFGISFRFDNHAKNHYFGSVGRIGRALSETQNQKEIEKAMLEIISNKEVDMYNRIVFYFLFDNYSHYLNQKDKNLEALKQKVFESFPLSIQKSKAKRD